MKPRTRNPSPSDDQTVVLGSSSWDALWDQALPVISADVRKEDGWRSALDEGKRLGITRQSAEKRLTELVRAGLFERRQGRGIRNMPMYFFRPLPPNGQAKRDSGRAR